MKIDQISDPTLNEVFESLSPYKSKKSVHSSKEVNKFLRFCDFEPGRLYKCHAEFPWIFGNLDDPTWFHDENRGLDNVIITSDEAEPICFVGPKLAMWVDQKTNQKCWAWFLSFIIRDVVGYFPIPSQMFDEAFESAKTEFRDLFSDAQEISS